jgi:hypothetical protein
MFRSGHRIVGLLFGLVLLDGRGVAAPAPDTPAPAITITLTRRLEITDHRGRLSADGKSLFVEWWDSTGKIRVLDAQTGKQVYAFEKEAIGFDLSPNGKLLTTLLTEFRSPDRPPKGQKEFKGEARYYNEMKVWDLADPKAPRQVLLIPDASRPVFSPDGKSLAVYHQRDGSPARQWELWSLEKGKRLAAFTVPPSFEYVPVFSPDGALLAFPGPDALTLHATATGREVRKLAHKSDPLQPGGVRCVLFARGNAGSRVAFSPDGKTLAAGGADGKVRLWEVSTGKLTGTLAGHREPHTFVRYSPDGGRLLTGSIGLSKVLHVAPGLPGGPPPPQAWVDTIDTSKGDVILWNARTLARERTLPIRCPLSLSWSRDGRILAEGDVSDSGPALLPSLHLWDATSGRQLGTWKDFEEGHFSSDGRTLLTSSYGRVVLWDVQRVRQK